MERNYKVEIEDWLNSLSDKTASMVLKVVADLEMESELSGGSYFLIPNGRIRESGVGEEDEKNIIYKLSRVGALSLESDKKEVPLLSYDPEYLQGSAVIEPPFRILASSLRERLGVRISEKKATRVNFSENLHDEDLPKLKYNWRPDLKISRGVLTLPDNSKMHFGGGNFGGLNILFENLGSYIKREMLKVAISEHHQQGKRNSPSEIVIANWKGELKKNRGKLFVYFDIEHLEPDSYRLIYKDQQ